MSRRSAARQEPYRRTRRHSRSHIAPLSLLQKTAIAVAYCKRGRGLIKINGVPIELVQPEALQYKVLCSCHLSLSLLLSVSLSAPSAGSDFGRQVFEPVLLLGSARFSNVDIRIRVKGGGFTSQVYGTPPFQFCGLFDPVMRDVKLVTSLQSDKRNLLGYFRTSSDPRCASPCGSSWTTLIPCCC